MIRPAGDDRINARYCSHLDLGWEGNSFDIPRPDHKIHAWTGRSLIYKKPGAGVQHTLSQTPKHLFKHVYVLTQHARLTCPRLPFYSDPKPRHLHRERRRPPRLRTGGPSILIDLKPHHGVRMVSRTTVKRCHGVQAFRNRLKIQSAGNGQEKA